jgi:hypothetical protein
MVKKFDNSQPISGITIFDTTRYIVDTSIMLGRHDTQHNDTQHNDTQHNGIQHNDTQHNGIQHNDTQHDDIQHNDNLLNI